MICFSHLWPLDKNFGLLCSYIFNNEYMVQKMFVVYVFFNGNKEKIIFY